MFYKFDWDKFASTRSRVLFCWGKIFRSIKSFSKLMRLDRPPPKYRSKSYSNRLLINFFDPNLLLKSIEIVATIRNLGPNLNLTLKSWSKFESYFKFISKMFEFDPKWSNLNKNLSNLIKKVRFLIKIDVILI